MTPAAARRSHMRKHIVPVLSFALFHFLAIVALQVLGVAFVASSYEESTATNAPTVFTMLGALLKVLGSPLGWLQGPDNADGLNQALLIGNSLLWGLVVRSVWSVRRSRRGRN